MAATNSSGDVTGKMIDALSIVVASTAARWFNHEGDILRYVFFYSIALACLVGFFVTLQVFVWLATRLFLRVARTFTTYWRSLVAVHASAAAQRAADEAIGLAINLHAGLCVLHVANKASLVQHGMEVGSFIDIENVSGKIRTAGSHLLNAAAAKPGAAGCQAQCRRIETARPRIAQIIADAAANRKADMIVVGAHGWRGLQRSLIGTLRRI